MDNIYKLHTSFDTLWSVDGGLHSGTINCCNGLPEEDIQSIMINYTTKLSKEIIYLDSNIYTDYIKSGKFKEELRKVFVDDTTPIIILDSLISLFDLLEQEYKLEYKQAEHFIINLLVESAQTGKCIIITQNIFRNSYFGSTHLKHAASTLFNIKSDSKGKRYIEFTKNIKNTNIVGKQIEFVLKKDNIKLGRGTFIKTDIKTHFNKLFNN